MDTGTALSHVDARWGVGMRKRMETAFLTRRLFLPVGLWNGKLDRAVFPLVTMDFLPLAQARHVFMLNPLLGLLFGERKL